MVFGDAARASFIAQSDCQGSWWSCTIAQEHNRAQHMSALASTRYTGQTDKLLQSCVTLAVFLVQLHSTGKHGPEKVRRAALLNGKNEKRTIAADLRRDRSILNRVSLDRLLRHVIRIHDESTSVLRPFLLPVGEQHPEIASCCSLLI